MKNKSSHNPFYTHYQEFISELNETKPNLRFGSNKIIISKIANQYYCEKQLELSEIHGRIENESMEKGKEGHESDIPFRFAVKPEKAWEEATQSTKRKPYTIREFHLLTKYKEVFIEGIVDEVSFFRGNVLSLTEFKFHKIPEPYDNDWVQCNIYGLLLNELGFNTDELLLNIIYLDPLERKQAIMLWEILDDNKKHMLGKQYKKNFNLKKSKQDLDWALDFWKMKREAVPTKMAWKCKHCNYSNLCFNRII